MSKRPVFYKTLFGLSLGLGLLSSQALAFPDRLVTLVVPFTPGSGSDIIARIVAPKLSERWKQSVIVDNKPGASGNIGAEAAAKAAPDGHTLLMAINSMTMAPHLYKRVGFDPSTDFSPIMKMAVANFAIVVNPQVAASDLPSLIAMAKARPGLINFGSPGNGTPHHLGMELLKQQMGFDMLHVPYRGISNATTDLIGGQVQVMFASFHSMLPHVKAGRLRMLAVTGGSRSPLLPNVATFKEVGIELMDTVDAWYAVLAPAKTAPDKISQLHRDFSAVLALPEVRDQMAAQGLTIQISSPEQLGSLVQSDMARWRKTVTDAKLTPE
ncbi:MAG: tripartite tricarboxylate transporter substrate binding protein [Burkholderiaceae bacterium]